MLSEVYNEDCMVGMARYPDKYFELAIVDPPYKDEVGGLNVGISRNFAYKHFRAPDSAYIRELFRVSKNQVIWGFNYFLEILPSTDSVIFWYKHQNGHFSEGEAAWSSIGKTRFYDRPYQLDVGDKIHPTQKPIALYRWLLKNYAKAGDKILDTHLGSGSSRIACHEAGYDFTGFELDFDYWKAQEDRFAAYLRQQRLFEPTELPPPQEALAL